MNSLPSLTKQEIKTYQIIRNRFVKGDPVSVRKIMVDLGYRSPRSVQYLLDSLVDKGYLRRNEKGKLLITEVIESKTTSSQTVQIPVYTANYQLSPDGIQPDESPFSIAVSMKLAPAPDKYVLVQLPDDALLGRDIPAGNLALIRRQNKADENDLVLVAVDRQLLVRIWVPTPHAVVLKADQEGFQPIILPADFQPLGIVVANLPRAVLT